MEQKNDFQGKNNLFEGYFLDYFTAKEVKFLLKIIAECKASFGRGFQNHLFNKKYFGAEYSKKDIELIKSKFIEFGILIEKKGCFFYEISKNLTIEIIEVKQNILKNTKNTELMINEKTTKNKINKDFSVKSDVEKLEIFKNLIN